MKAVAREFVHPNGIRRIRIYARSDGAFLIAEELSTRTTYDPEAPFSYWADTYLRSGPLGASQMRWLKSQRRGISKTTKCLLRGIPGR